MRIRLAVWSGSTSATPRHLTVTTPEGCPPDELRSDRLAARLSDALGVPGDALCVRDRVLDDAALLGRPPLLDGASVRLLVRNSWAPLRSAPPAAATEIAAIGGPDAGRTRPLTAGTHTVGRAGADLTIGDPSLSRSHLRVDVGPAGVTLTDLGSENGTLLDDEPAPDTATEVRIGAILRLGHTTLAIRHSRSRPATTTPRGDGTLLVSRSGAPPPRPPVVRIDVPPHPDPPPPRRVPWPAALIPLPIAGLLAWLFGPHLLLLAVMSPLMLLGSYVSDRIGARKAHALALREHVTAMEGCARARAAALTAERTWRENAYPDLAAVARIASTPGTALWGRARGAPLLVRLGYGPVESSVTWVESGSGSLLPLDRAPATLDLSAYAGLAVSGPLVDRVADGLLGQLVTLHSPHDLVVLTDRTDWAPAPHVRVGQGADVVRLAREMLTDRADPPAGPERKTSAAVVLAIDTTRLSGDDVEALTALIRECPGTGVHVLLTGDPLSAVGAHLETSASGCGLLRRAGLDPIALTVDGAAAEWAGRVATALAPLRDTTGHPEDLPARVSLTEALDEAGREQSLDGITRQWASADDGAWVTLGTSAGGTYRLDLAAAGPHALIGGTTGSGKSELLRTLVVSLAAAHPPEDVAVALVDYKGGSAFAGLEALPHIVGVVTDLDGALTARALTSLKAEIHRRERLFGRAGAADILGYREHSRRSGSELPHLARLVIVVDEFRALADELPDFVTGLVRLAAVGRSLGVHLVLATQRPAGVVTSDMRANLGLRIALRVRDRTDSQDVIESDAAARLSRSTPGRALVRCGAEPLVAFQTATVDPGDASADLTVEIAWSDGTTTTRRYPLAAADTPADIVSTIAAAARGGRHQAPPSPWLPPLPGRVAWHEAHPSGAWALHDDPARQRQDPVLVDLATMPHTAIAGAIGSGRTTTLLALIAASLAAGGERTHLYALTDPTGALAPLARLPHTGAVVDRSDPAQVAGLVDRLAAVVRDRTSAPATTRLLLVVDGWDVLADACDALDHGALTDRLLATLREGYALGLRAIITGDRSVLTGRVGRTLPERILLRPADAADLALAGISPGAVPAPWPPGRAIRVADGAELQVLLRTPDRGMAPAPQTPPWRLTALPQRLAVGSLPSAPDDRVALAVSSQSADAVTVGQPGRRRVLVIGSAGAGRTGTLATIAAQSVLGGRRVCVIGDPHSPLVERLHEGRVGVERLSWDAHDDLVDLRRAHADLVVLADDVDRYVESPLVPVLAQIADLAERDGGLIVVAGDGAALAMRARGIG
ncbi:MAG: FtsK/SpoIIIE domain-containing protein, partial [Dermatophilaceae bacterium]